MDWSTLPVASDLESGEKHTVVTFAAAYLHPAELQMLPKQVVAVLILGKDDLRYLWSDPKRKHCVDHLMSIAAFHLQNNYKNADIF
jgi:hypothetical protein